MKQCEKTVDVDGSVRARAKSKSVYPAACEKEERRNTGILHFVQDDDFKK
jgi:hypothetical protein